MTTFTIRLGFDESQRAQVGAIYFAAFEKKLSPFIGKGEVGIGVTAEALNADRCFIAADEAGRVLGVAGFARDKRRLLELGPGGLRRVYGFLSGTVRGLILAFYVRESDDHLQMDGIAVTADARGTGVGTGLLEAVTGFASENGYVGTRLDVVNTNPNARRFYERVGFIPVRTASYPYLQFLGFTSVTTMVKRT